MDNQGPIEYPVEGTLDLHTFHPKEVKGLIHNYLKACHRKEIFSVRIVHGKGNGTLRDCVHAQLRKLNLVKNFRLGNEFSGGWGATIVYLRH